MPPKNKHDYWKGKKLTEAHKRKIKEKLTGHTASALHKKHLKQAKKRMWDKIRKAVCLN